MRREWMIKKRESMGLSRKQMAKRCNPKNCNGHVSEKLLEMLEEDDTNVTSPALVERIAEQYHIRKKEQKLGLIPKNYRPGPDYDPDRYKFAESPIEVFKAFRVVPYGGRGIFDE